MRRWRSLNRTWAPSCWAMTPLVLWMLVQTCTAPGPQQPAARVLIDDARAYIGGGGDEPDALPPPASQAGRASPVSPPAMAPSMQQQQDTGPLANFGLSYTGGAVTPRWASPPMPSTGQGARQQQQSPAPAPALAPAQACQQGIACPGKLQFTGAPSVGLAMASVPSVASQGSAPRSVPGQSFSGPVVASPPPAPLRSPSKALPPGAFQKAVPAPKTELTFKST